MNVCVWVDHVYDQFYDLTLYATRHALVLRLLFRNADNELNSWTSTIVALPIVMYTSWILYERSEFSPS